MVLHMSSLVSTLKFMQYRKEGPHIVMVTGNVNYFYQVIYKEEFRTHPKQRKESNMKAIVKVTVFEKERKKQIQLL